jgi:glycosyltransferase involved in cell wall biosynthesis
MISWEFEPYYVRGGTAYAIRRLADQLTELGIETRVLLPDWQDTDIKRDPDSLLIPIPVTMRPELRTAPRVLQCIEFCRAALDTIEQTGIESDAVVGHSDECAMFIVLCHGKRAWEPSVFWLHSLYDPPISELTKEQLRHLPSESLLASAVMMGDIVVTSSGVLKDACEFEWPGNMKALQQALLTASAEDRVLTVESAGCLPPVSQNSADKIPQISTLENLNKPYVLFPGRPTVDKGLEIFAAMAERLRADNIACVAVRPPSTKANTESQSRNLSIQWLPWLSQQELRVAMRNSACTVLPSITEGFGLAAAESISLGVPTLYQQVGGHHGLQARPNAVPVSLTTTERELLYGLWSELVSTHPDSWTVWTRHEASFRPLVDKWVEAIRLVIKDGVTVEHASASEHPADERWGNKLCERIETGLKVKSYS